MPKTSGITHTLRPDSTVTVRIESLALGGEGLSKDLGVPIFVDLTAPGDRVEVELFDVRKNFARGRLVKIIEPSKERTEPPCPLFKVCGGCQLQHLSYEFQLQAKADFVKQAVKHIARLDANIVLPAIGAAPPWHYRNKAQFPTKNPQGSLRLLAGYYKRDSHELVNIKHCPVQPELLDQILQETKQLCEMHRLPAYNEATHKGLIRHINLRYSFADQNALVVLVLNQPKASSTDSDTLSVLKELSVQLMDKIPAVVGVCANFNSRPGNKILGNETLSLAGQDHIHETLASERDRLPERLRHGLRYRLSPTSFFQVNTVQAIKLLEVVHDFVTDDGKEKPKLVLDAYAGVGTIALWLTASAQHIIAVEEQSEAIADMRQNLQLNEIDNVTIVPGRVEDILPRLKSEGLAPDTVLLDPPRKGLSDTALAAVMQLAPARIIYVSCNPATLARDLRILAAGADFGQPNDVQKEAIIGYKAMKIVPVDLFPHTYHVETVTLLARQ